MTQRSLANGFTLIETLIYIALLSMIIVGSLLVTYQIIQSSQSDHGRLINEAEADFVQHKFDWALYGATSVKIYASPLRLEASHYGLDVCFSVSGNAIVIKRELCSASTLTPVAITTQNAIVSNASFSRAGSVVTVAFALNGDTSTSTHYLR